MERTDGLFCGQKCRTDGFGDDVRHGNSRTLERISLHEDSDSDVSRGYESSGKCDKTALPGDSHVSNLKEEIMISPIVWWKEDKGGNVYV